VPGHTCRDCCSVCRSPRTDGARRPHVHVHGPQPWLRAVSARSHVRPVDSVAMAPTSSWVRPSADGCCGSATRSCRTTPTSDCLDFSWAGTRRPPPRPPPAQRRMCRACQEQSGRQRDSTGHDRCRGFCVNVAQMTFVNPCITRHASADHMHHDEAGSSGELLYQSARYAHEQCSYPHSLPSGKACFCTVRIYLKGGPGLFGRWASSS